MALHYNPTTRIKYTNGEYQYRMREIYGGNITNNTNLGDVSYLTAP